MSDIPQKSTFIGSDSDCMQRYIGRKSCSHKSWVGKQINPIWYSHKSFSLARQQILSKFSILAASLVRDGRKASWPRNRKKIGVNLTTLVGTKISRMLQIQMQIQIQIQMWIHLPTHMNTDMNASTKKATNADTGSKLNPND